MTEISKLSVEKTQIQNFESEFENIYQKKILGVLDKKNSAEDLEKNKYEVLGLKDFEAIFLKKSKTLNSKEFDFFYLAGKNFLMAQREKFLFKEIEIGNSGVEIMMEESTNFDKAFVISCYQNALDLFNNESENLDEKDLILDDLGVIIFNGGSGSHCTTPNSDIDAVWVLKDGVESDFGKIQALVLTNHFKARSVQVLDKNIINTGSDFMKLSGDLEKINKLDWGKSIKIISQFEDILIQNNLLVEDISSEISDIFIRMGLGPIDINIDFLDKNNVEEVSEKLFEYYKKSGCPKKNIDLELNKLINSKDSLLVPNKIFQDILGNFFQKYEDLKKAVSYQDPEHLNKSLNLFFKSFTKDLVGMLREHLSLDFVVGDKDFFKKYRNSWSELFKNNAKEIQAIFMAQYEEFDKYPRVEFNVKKKFRFLQYALGITLLEDGEIFPKNIAHRVDELKERGILADFEAQRIKNSIDSIFYLRHLLFLFHPENLDFSEKNVDKISFEFISWAENKGVKNIEEVIHKARISPYHTSLLYSKQKKCSDLGCVYEKKEKNILDENLDNEEKFPVGFFIDKSEKKIFLDLDKIKNLEDKPYFLKELFMFMSSEEGGKYFLDFDSGSYRAVQNMVVGLKENDLQNIFLKEYMGEPHFYKLVWFLSRLGVLRELVPPYGETLGKVKKGFSYDLSNQTLRSLEIFDKEIKSGGNILFQKMGEKIDKKYQNIFYWAVILGNSEKKVRNEFIENLSQMTDTEKSQIKFLIKNKTLLTQNGFDVEMASGNYFNLAERLQQKLAGQEDLIEPLLALNYVYKKSQKTDEKNLKNIDKNFGDFYVQFKNFNLIKDLTEGDRSKYLWKFLEEKIGDLEGFSDAEKSNMQIFLENYKKNPEFIYGRILEIISDETHIENFEKAKTLREKLNFITENFDFDLFQKKSEVANGDEKYLLKEDSENSDVLDFWISIDNDSKILKDLGISLSNLGTGVIRASIFPLKENKIMVHMTVKNDKFNSKAGVLKELLDSENYLNSVGNLKNIENISGINVVLDLDENAFEISSEKDSLYIFSRVMEVLEKNNLRLKNATFIPYGENGFRDKIFIEGEISLNLEKDLLDIFEV